MTNKTLSDRILYIADSYFGGNRTSLAQAVGISPSTLNRLLASRDEKKLAKQCPAILEALPFIDNSWLLCGEGNPPDQGPFPPALSACNHKEKPVGDLLRDFFDFYDISREEIIKFTGITDQKYDAILSSRQYPDFQFLEQLYWCFGFNPAFCFHGDERNMSDPKGNLERALKAIGVSKKYLPSHRELERWFGATKEEAKEFLARCRDGKQNLREYGRIALENGDLETEDGEPILGFPALPSAWVDYFKQNLVFNVGLLRDGNAQPVIWEEQRGKINSTQINELEKKVAELNAELHAAHREQVQAWKQVAELERQLRLTEQSTGDFPLKGLASNRVTNKTVALGVPQDGIPE